ncbi:unnamed protein product [Merluccius merluccius]
METRLGRSAKKWQLNGTDCDREAVRTGPRTAAGPPSGTRFSAWTPLVNKPSNQQLFEERSSLLLHWFDLWSDRQRKQLLQALLNRCSTSQLKVCRDWLMVSLPVVRVDFTTVLPRFMALYVMSFLNPRDLSAAAQVSWHWRVLAEQDCLWSGRCVRRGWFLPYSPVEKEYGAWKSHYVSCVSTLDWSPPLRDFHQPADRGVVEDEEEKEERRIRQLIRERLHQEKSELGRQSEREKLSSSTSRPPQPHHTTIPVLVLLVSNSIPAYELVLCGARAEVLLVLYDGRGTLLALLAQLERALAGRRARRLGLLCPGGTEELRLIHGVSLSEQTVLVPDTRDFWEKMCGWVVPSEEGGGVDIFSPLAASGLRSEEVEDGQRADGENRRTGGEDTDGLLQTGPSLLPELAQMALDWRGAVVRELHHSEEQYQARLAAVLKVYHEPLTAAVDSNRPIISHASVHMKSNSERDRLMEDTQRKIQCCPNLCEGDRQLIMTQDAALLKSPGKDIPDSLRTYEQVCDLGLFLFSDALVLTKRTVRHTPFSLAHQSTHTFLASVALNCLEAREITHSRYVHNAFILDGPSRSWTCTMERAEDSERFLFALRLAAHAAIQAHG